MNDRSLRNRLPAITVPQLEYLVAIADADTWADAAQTLAITPSALSQGVAELERRLGCAVFERQGRRRVIPVASTPIVDYARRVLAETDDLRRWIDASVEGTEGSLRLGMIDAAALGHFPVPLDRFRRTIAPGATFTLTVAPSAELLDMLERGELDLAIIVRPSEQPVGIEWTALLTEDLAVYAPPDAAVGAPNAWGPWVAFPGSSHTTKQAARALRELGAPFDVVAESHQPDVIREMVRLGMGWAILPVIQAETGANPLRRARPAPLLERTLVAARRSGTLPNPLADRLLSELGSETSS